MPTSPPPWGGGSFRSRGRAGHWGGSMSWSRDHFEDAVRFAEPGSTVAVEAVVSLGSLLGLAFGRPESGLAHLQAAGTEARRIGSDDWLIRALCAQGRLLAFRGQPDQGVERLQEAVSIDTLVRHGDQWAQCRADLAAALGHAGQPDEAVDMLREAREALPLENVAERVRLCAIRAHLEQRRGRPEAALEPIDEPLVASARMGSRTAHATLTADR